MKHAIQFALATDPCDHAFEGLLNLSCTALRGATLRSTAQHKFSSYKYIVCHCQVLHIRSVHRLNFSITTGRRELVLRGTARHSTLRCATSSLLSPSPGTNKRVCLCKVLPMQSVRSLNFSITTGMRELVLRGTARHSSLRYITSSLHSRSPGTNKHVCRCKVLPMRSFHCVNFSTTTIRRELALRDIARHITLWYTTGSLL